MSDQATGNDIYVHRFNLAAGGKTLFRDSKLVLVQGRRYGLIGPNGCGKTTLMHAIATRDDEFAKSIPAHIDILLVEQEVQANDTSALQMVIEADTKRIALLAEEKKLTERQQQEGLSDEEEIKIADRLNEVYEELEDIGASSAEQRASQILSGLQFTEEQKSWPTKQFSGGWRMRISLARALFRKPRLLLLDEPTNHLDLHAVIWLEGYLQKWKNTLVVVSHDRDFLSTVTTDILHCFQTKLVHYVGNFEVFEKVYAQKIEEYKEAYEKQQKRLKALKKAGKITTNVSQTSRNESKTKQKERQKLMAAGKAKSLPGMDGSDEEEVGEELMEPLKEANIHISFREAGEVAMPLCQVNECAFGYSADKILFRNVNFGINLDSRIALVGANGTGKSTLLKLLTGELVPVVGDCMLARQVKIGVYNQHSTDQLTVGMNPVTYLQHKFGDLNYQSCRNALGKFGLEGRHHEQEIGTLSGGQKSRVVFVELGMSRAHILLLDEPTNHLDLETVDALIEGLTNFKGGLMVITHNVSLISKVCNEIWICGDEAIERFPGEFEEYRDKLEEEMKELLEDEEEAEKERRKKKEVDAAGLDEEHDPTKPKSKAQRDRERKQQKEAAKKKAEEDAAAKKAEEEAAKKEEEEKQRAAEEARRARRCKDDEEMDMEAAMALIATLPPSHAAHALPQLQDQARIADCTDLVLPFCKAVFTDDVEQQLAQWAQPLRTLKQSAQNPYKAEMTILGWVEDLVVVQRPALLVRTAPILKLLYDEDVLEEEIIIEWHEKLPEGDTGRKARKYAMPFVVWLKEAEFESE